MLPRVTIDFTNHPLWSGSEYYLKANLNRVLYAELLMININKGTIRVRLIDPETDEVLMKNYDTHVDYVVDNEVVVHLGTMKRE